MSARQVVILRYLAQGRAIEDIADELGYAVSTIKKEVHLAIRHCGARNRAHAVAVAIRGGLI
jgi:DNA-binding NarL/FixJ family response regulator